ncbi:MAG TPA: MraY family glycosyltransferase [Flavobacteriales bacterium]|nr:undecaprenyl/decaprenyl-phosphate alpha-N-acetylglucosaminyl 1-phosphate transferase [Flavobacteriales bacterium]MCB0783073.1 undecaprenyl/decaprenyl-phosphate alpha-N-acetylglucosaminyl 1-phosphate transferase [Flavobacteriales bacterium]MCB0787760.1 undecaprenyl/decaprenyl-phosphate alpha-N-acetylglucosaminyl 1-phosphate transferase [Flavobacteriales bacterium]MCB0807727.1 undecaprenyl/decaprenyl-phosphate alpha-N-acetylglucosaminyl 1-phosphate transferase [Flavobacteriales bacterium]MCB08
MYTSVQLFLILSGLFFGALVFSLLLNSVFLRFARTLGIREKDRNGELVRWSASAKPAFGGIAFFIIFLGSWSIYSTLFPHSDRPVDPQLLGLLAATGVGFLMGLADDAYNTRPLLKFLVQVSCAVILIISGSSIQLFHDPLTDGLLTVLWVVGMMNSINMLDNMDAITTVVSIFILLAALVAALLTGDPTSPDLVLIVGTMAALFGFLFYNWHPSRLFMGDTGSQFLGVYLAFVGIRYFWNMPTAGEGTAEFRPVITTLIVFLLPIVDTTTVTINRLLRGNSPFVGGRDHTTHHLGYAGFSDPQVALIFAGISTVSLFLTFVNFRFIQDWRNTHALIFVLYALLVFGTLYVMTRRNRNSS